MSTATKTKPSAEGIDILTRTSKNEFDTRSVKQEQKAPVKMPDLTDPFSLDSEIITHDDELDMDYLDQLSFFEEPVKILIHRGSDAIGSRTTDYVANQGVPAELLIKGKGWVPVGFLPRGQSIIIKRKIVAQLAAARLENVKTNVIERDGHNPDNYLERTITHPCPFSVLEDRNPKGADWLTKTLSYNM